MPKTQNRRHFLTAAACAGGCLLARSLAAQGEVVSQGIKQEKKSYDFDKLTYCCFECRPELCPLLKASLSNDPEGKKKIAAEWRVKYGREFAPEEVFCFGCKVEPARQGANIKACDVRKCVIEKGLTSCAHCRELAGCKRELWINYPEFRQHVLKIQKDILG